MQRCERFVRTCVILLWAVFGCAPKQTQVAVAGPPSCALCKLLVVKLVTGVQPTSIVLGSKHAYFTTLGPPGPSTPKVISVPLQGGSPVTIEATARTATSIGLHGSELYWFEVDASSLSQSGVWAANVSGSGLAKIFSTQTDISGPHALIVASGANDTPQLFVANPYFSMLFKLTPDAFHWSSHQLIPQHEPPPTPRFYYPYTVVADSQNLHFLSDDGRLYRVSRSGGTPAFVLDHGERALLATDDKDLYFVKDGAIRRLPVGGGSVTSFVASVGTVGDMTIAGGTLYWTCKSCGTVMKQLLTGTTSTTLAAQQPSPGPLAVGSTRVYFGTTESLSSVAK